MAETRRNHTSLDKRRAAGLTTGKPDTISTNPPNLDARMTTIDPTARIEDGAVIGEGTSIGPYCIIGPHVVIGANCRLIAHVHVTAQTTIGDGCTIYPFVSLGTPPQSLNYRGELTRLEIGQGCTIREQVTMNAGTVGGGGIIRVGDRGYFMNCSHVGHACPLANDLILRTWC